MICSCIRRHNWTQFKCCQSLRKARIVVVLHSMLGRSTRRLAWNYRIGRVNVLNTTFSRIRSLSNHQSSNLPRNMLQTNKSSAAHPPKKMNSKFSSNQATVLLRVMLPPLPRIHMYAGVWSLCKITHRRWKQVCQRWVKWEYANRIIYSGKLTLLERLTILLITPE